MSLYSKYRPQNFANLVGQDHIRLTLLHEIQKGALTHAYLFAGPRGTGKTSTARLIAKALNCEKKNEEGEPCDECDFCTTIKEGALIDVIEIDAASNRGIDEIRELKEKIQFAPTRAKSKIYIIDEVHMLTKEAFNALLKTLEEPPENVYFILCTTEVHKIPETIISRCQRFDFKRIDIRTIMTRLNYIAQMEQIEAEPEAIELIARHVEGGLRDAIGLLEQMAISGKLLAEHVRTHLGITGHQTVISLIEVLEKKDITKALHIVNEIHHEGYDLTSFVREILEELRNRLVDGIQKNDEKTEFWLSMIELFEEARNMLRNTVIPQLPIEIAVIKICGTDAAISMPETKIEEEKTIVVEQTAEAQEAEQETAQQIKQEYEMEQFKKGDISKHWQRVLEHIQPPSLKRSLSDAKVSEKDEGIISLIFGSRFHMEKVNLAENRPKIEKAITHLFGKNVKVTCVLDVQGVKSAAKTQLQQQKKSEPKPQKTVEELTKKALEIFGSDE